MSASDYLALLEERKLFPDAVRFLVHKLPTSKGIEWGARAVRELQGPDQVERNRPCLEASEKWLKAPGDPTRWEARKAADKSGMTGPADCVAMAVFLSGGSVTPPESPHVAPPPYTAQKLLTGGIQIAVVAHTPERAEERYRRALAIGRQLDQGVKT